jgi:hypothetical protein
MSRLMPPCAAWCDACESWRHSAGNCGRDDCPRPDDATQPDDLLAAQHWAKQSGQYRLQRDELLAACMAADAAMNPTDRSGISLHVWNQRLREATSVVRAAIAKAEGK